MFIAGVLEKLMGENLWALSRGEVSKRKIWKRGTLKAGGVSGVEKLIRGEFSLTKKSRRGGHEGSRARRTAHRCK